MAPIRLLFDIVLETLQGGVQMYGSRVTTEGSYITD